MEQIDSIFDNNSTMHYRQTEHIEDREQFVTFQIADETYGVEVLKVQEIIGMTKITAIPNSLEYLMGVINLRGLVVPVVDMRLKFNMKPREYDFFTVILIVEVKKNLVGMIVDTVSDVVDIASKDISTKINMNANVHSEFISGIANKDDSLIIILDTEKMLTREEMKEIDSIKNDKGTV